MPIRCFRTGVAGFAVVAAVVSLGAGIAGAREVTASAPARAPATEVQAMLAAVNAVRREHHLPALTLDSRLSQAAGVQARYLARTQKLDHRGADGSRVGQRAERAGYHWSTVAENLALAPESSPREVVGMWMNSRGHRENLLNRQITQMGIAHVGDIWVQVFARPR